MPNIPSKIDVPDLPAQKLNFETSAIDNFKASLETSIEPIKISTSAFENSLIGATNVVTAFSNSLVNAADQISRIQAKNFAEFESKKIPSLSSESADKNILPNFDKKFKLPLDLPKDVSAELKAATHQMAELTKTAGAIAQDMQKRQQQSNQQNITVSPNININLGGAYVFDNAMKLKLTDDITTEVANAIKDAVRNATNNLDIPRY